MKTDYDYYLIGCRDAEVEPLSIWRFTVAYAKYRQMHKWVLDDWHELQPKKRARIVARWIRLRRLGELVQRGQDIATRAAHYGSDDESGTAGAGTREPRRPLSPVLTGCAARHLLSPDPCSGDSWWRI